MFVSFLKTRFNAFMQKKQNGRPNIVPYLNIFYLHIEKFPGQKASFQKCFIQKKLESKQTTKSMKKHNKKSKGILAPYY